MINQKPKVICVGSMGKDIFFPIDPTQMSHGAQYSTTDSKWFNFEYGSKIHVEDRYNALGGCACNVSIGLARLGVHVSACGNIGSDAEGKWIMDVLQEESVDIEKVHMIENAKTDLSVILVDTVVGERTIFVNRDVGERLIITENDINNAQWCYVSSLYGENLRNNMHVLHHAVTSGKIMLAYNPGGNNIAHDADIVLDLIHHARIVFVNRTEAREIIAHFDSVKNEKNEKEELYLLHTLKQHMKDDNGVVVLTDGRNGAWACGSDEILRTTTIDKDPHDTTGAGDAFASGFLGGFLYGKTLTQCMQWGGANSDSVIDHYGAQKGLLRYDIIEKQSRMFDVKK